MSQSFISTSEIARLAGVDISTVSNWRRRYGASGFPQPAANDAGSRPKFDRDEINKWLRENPQVGTREAEPGTTTDAAINMFRSVASPNEALEIVGRMLHLVVEDRRQGRSSRTAPEIRGGIDSATSISGPARPIGADPIPDRLLETSYALLVDVRDPLAVYDDALRRVNRMSPKSSAHTTPDALTDFILALADYNPDAVVYDPAAGYGGLLLAALARGKGARGIGVEVDPAAAAIADRRCFLADASVTIRVGESLLDDPAAGLVADLVVVDSPPPAKLVLDRARLEQASWDFGIPKPTNADMGWLQHAVAHLTPGGRAIVVTEMGALMHQDKATSHIRNELVRRGAVKAAFALPGRLRRNGGNRLAVWVLGVADPADRRTSVLLVDAGSDDKQAILPDGSAVAAFQTWMKDETAGLDSSFAVAVPVTDLLAPDTTLLPSRWTVNPVEELTAEQWQERVKETYAAAEAAVTRDRVLPRISTAVTRGPVARRTLGELARSGDVSILKGRHAERPTGSGVASYPILTVEQVRSRAAVDPQVAEQVTATDSTTAQLVEPGDVLIYLDGQNVTARVWPESGWVLGRFMQAVRLASPHWTAHYLAAAINNPANQKHALDGAIRTHFTIENFEVAAQPVASQRAFSEVAAQLDTISAELRAAAALVSAAQAELSNALASGSITANVR